VRVGADRGIGSLTWRRRAALQALAAALLASACGHRPAMAPDIALAWSLSPRAPAVGSAVLRLALSDRRGGPAPVTPIRTGNDR
jgi:hypothetical protein